MHAVARWFWEIGKCRNLSLRSRLALIITALPVLLLFGSVNEALWMLGDIVGGVQPSFVVHDWLNLLVDAELCQLFCFNIKKRLRKKFPKINKHNDEMKKKR